MTDVTEPPASTDIAEAGRGCSVSRTLDLIGDGWSFLVLRSAFFGVRRFEGFLADIGLVRNVLAERLSRLTQAGVFERRLYQSRPDRYEYRLTDKGRALYPIFVSMMLWGDRWASGDGEVPLILEHIECGGRIGATMRCSACHGALTADEVAFEVLDPSALVAGPPAQRRRRTSNPDLYRIGRRCSVANTVAIFDDRWSFMILREAFFGTRRFDDLVNRLGIAPNILADRLASMTAYGVFDRRMYQSGPDRHDYVLTQKGRDLYPSILAMIRWGDAWLTAPGEVKPLELRHKICGAVFTPVLCCDHCGGEITARNVRYRATDAARPATD